MPGFSAALGLTLWASAPVIAPALTQPHADAVLGAPLADEEPKTTTVWHVIVPAETYDDISSRYGVSKNEILKWNKKRLGEKKWLIAGHKLKIIARRSPPPREKINYVVRKGDTWSGLAKKFGVESKVFRGLWNKKASAKLRPGTVLKAWTNPQEVAADLTSPAEGEIPEFNVPGGGFASGRPNRGHLTNGVQLPTSEYYTVRKPERAYGTSNMILAIQQAIATFRIKSGYEGEILVGDISQKGGGKLPPHGSHRTGRDADIRLPRLAGVAKDKTPSPDEIDWAASWILLRSFIEVGEIEYIFLSYNRQKLLLRAAKAAGADADYLKKHIQYPQGSGTNNGTIRHAKGHTIHFHVRVKCSSDAPTCESY